MAKVRISQNISHCLEFYEHSKLWYALAIKILHFRVDYRLGI